MSNQNNIKKLGEIADVFTGVRLSRYEKGNTTAKQALLHKSITQNNSNIEPEIVEVNTEIDKKYLTQKDDIIFKLQGTPFGKRITTETNIIVSHSFAIIRVKENVNPTYIENFLNYPTVQYELKVLANESLIPQINTSTLKNFKINIPTTDEQSKYGEIVNLIDQRIKANEKLIANDQEMKISLITKIIGDNHG